MLMTVAGAVNVATAYLECIFYVQTRRFLHFLYDFILIYHKKYRYNSVYVLLPYTRGAQYMARRPHTPRLCLQPPGLTTVHVKKGPLMF